MTEHAPSSADLDVGKATAVSASDIRWSTDDARLFEDLEINVGALSRPELEIYALELRGECRFLRIAWRRACERLQAQGVDGLRLACEPYRARLASAFKAESESAGVPDTRQ